MSYIANEKRYSEMKYNKCGVSGLKLPAVSLGLWHNFGDNADEFNMKKTLKTFVAILLVLASVLCFASCNTVEKTGVWENATYLRDKNFGSTTYF